MFETQKNTFHIRRRKPHLCVLLECTALTSPLQSCADPACELGRLLHRAQSTEGSVTTQSRCLTGMSVARSLRGEPFFVNHDKMYIYVSNALHVPYTTQCQPPRHVGAPLLLHLIPPVGVLPPLLARLLGGRCFCTLIGNGKSLTSTILEQPLIVYKLPITSDNTIVRSRRTHLQQPIFQFMFHHASTGAVKLDTLRWGFSVCA